MKNRIPSRPIVPDFDAVPRKYRHDGWTEARQRGFIDALAETGSVTAAAARVNMAKEGAYFLRRQPGADGFRRAWNAAIDHGVQNLVDLAIDRAIEGVPSPIFHQGEQVGERRRYNDRLLMFILKHHLPSRYGGAGLPDGTRHPDTIAQEAWERQHEAHDAAEEMVLRQGRALAVLLRHHRHKAIAAGAALAAGDGEAAAILEQQARIIEDTIDSDPRLWGLAGGLERLHDPDTAARAHQSALPGAADEAERDADEEDDGDGDGDGDGEEPDTEPEGDDR